MVLERNVEGIRIGAVEGGEARSLLFNLGRTCSLFRCVMQKTKHPRHKPSKVAPPTQRPTDKTESLYGTSAYICVNKVILIHTYY